MSSCSLLISHVCLCYKGFEPEDCARLINEDYWYAGEISIAMSDRPCIEWQTLNDTMFDQLDLFPDESWESLSNKCR